MKVNLISINRQHILDTAKSLHDAGADVRFYTMVPKKRCKSYGLPYSCCYSFFSKMVLLYILNRIFKNKYYEKVQRAFRNHVMSSMRQCDAIIINGYGLGFDAEDYNQMKKKYGAVVIMEWGSKHIIEDRKAQNAIETYPKKWYDLDMTKYDSADYISIPALHVKDSFTMHKIPESKLFINPYGANLSFFKPSVLQPQHFDLIMVGNWGMRKGCDMIIELCVKYGYKFLHVGPLGDITFPKDVETMHHIDAVDEKTLPQYYTQAKVFILPSRTEGLALVQAQAMACGLPMVCSKNTGGIDLARIADAESATFVFDDYDIEAIKDCVVKALAYADNQKGKRVVAKHLEKLSWQRYGKTYYEFLKEIIK